MSQNASILNVYWYVVIVCLHYVRVNVMGGEGRVPGGCTMTTVGASVQVHLQLKGLVDFDKEVSLSLGSVWRKITSFSVSLSLSSFFHCPL